MSKISTVLSDEHSGIRLDKAVSLCFPDITRSAAQKLITKELVIVDGEIKDKNYVLKAGQVIELDLLPPTETEIKPENIPLDIRYEDSDLLVVNKPKGMVVHPAPGNYCGTLVNALLYYCKDSLSGINGMIRPGIVHRIDKDTSGLLIVAKNDNSHKMLANQIKDHSFTREYEAIVYGNVKQDSGTIRSPIGRSQKDRKKMAVTIKNSRMAVTHFKVIKRYKKFTYVKLTLETGRTHQIRVHMAYIGYPLVGDMIYGPKNKLSGLNGQCLHASKIGFIHPTHKIYIEVKSELPEYFADFITYVNSNT